MLTQVRRWGWLFNPITVYVAWDREPRRAGGDRARGHQHAVAGTAPLHRCPRTRCRTTASTGIGRGSARRCTSRRSSTSTSSTSSNWSRTRDGASHRAGHRRRSSGYRGDRARDRDLARPASGDPTRARSQLANTAGADTSSLGRYLRRGDAVVAPWGDVRPPPVEARRTMSGRRASVDGGQLLGRGERSRADALRRSRTVGIGSQQLLRGLLRRLTHDRADAPRTNSGCGAEHDCLRRTTRRPGGAARRRDRRARPQGVRSGGARGLDRPRSWVHRGLVVERRSGRPSCAC